MLSPTFYQNSVLRHSVWCFVSSLIFQPRPAEQRWKGHELAVSSADKGTVTLSQPLQPWAPLVAPFNPGHGVWCMALAARRDEQQEGMLPAPCWGSGCWRE